MDSTKNEDKTETEASDLEYAAIEKEIISLAKRLAMNRLNRRECAAKDIENYLRKKKISANIIVQVISELTEARYLNDDRFGGIMTLYQSGRGKGPLWIKNKLKEKGIHREPAQIRELIEERTGNTELDLAVKIVERRYPRAGEEKDVAIKAIQALMRRGFSYGVAKSAVKKCGEQNDLAFAENLPTTMGQPLDD